MDGAMNQPAIIVTGSNGQLGSELKDLSGQYPQFNFVFLSREDVSITEKEKLQKVFEQYHPAWLVNCAAYTAVDKAETEQETAFEINGNAVGHLAFLCHGYKTGFIHISTDYVFNGNKKLPWKEEDETDPLNVYGASKLLGEFMAQKNNPDSIIIRTSWVYSSYGKNFVKTMLRLMKEKDSLSVVNDQQGCPTYAADLADAIMHIIGHGEIIPGIFHYCNQGLITWFEFAQGIRNRINSGCQLHPISTSQFPTPAARPAYSALDTSKIRRSYGIGIKNWESSLDDCLKKMNVTS